MSELGVREHTRNATMLSLFHVLLLCLVAAAEARPITQRDAHAIALANALVDPSSFVVMTRRTVAPALHGGWNATDIFDVPPTHVGDDDARFFERGAVMFRTGGGPEPLDAGRVSVPWAASADVTAPLVTNAVCLDFWARPRRTGFLAIYHAFHTSEFTPGRPCHDDAFILLINGVRVAMERVCHIRASFPTLVNGEQIGLMGTDQFEVFSLAPVKFLVCVMDVGDDQGVTELFVEKHGIRLYED